jgi:hypothetical protein
MPVTIALEEHFWTAELAAATPDAPAPARHPMWGPNAGSGDQLRDLRSAAARRSWTRTASTCRSSRTWPRPRRALPGAEGLARAREANDLLAAAVAGASGPVRRLRHPAHRRPAGRGRRARPGHRRAGPDRRAGQQHPRLQRGVPRRRQVRAAARPLRAARRAAVPAPRAALGGAARGAVQRAAAGRGGPAGHRRVGLARRGRPARAADDRHRRLRPASRPAPDRRALRRDAAVHAGPGRRDAAPGRPGDEPRPGTSAATCG